MAGLKMAGFWVLKILIALLFIAAAGAKLAGVPMMVQEFAQIGLGQWFRYFTALVEIVGAGLLLWPKTTPLGAVALACVCIGAFFAQVGVLHQDWIHTVVLGAINAAIAWSQRTRLPKLAARPA